MSQKMREPRTPDEALQALKSVPADRISIGGDLSSDQATSGQDLLKDRFDFDRPRAEVFLGGFVSTTAQDIYKMTGSQDDAQRAEDLIPIFGESLYKEIKLKASCCGHNNEADWLAQQLWALFEADLFDISGAEDKRNKSIDDQASSPINRTISKYLRESNLGRLVQTGRAEGVSNASALQAGVFNFLQGELLKGY